MMDEGSGLDRNAMVALISALRVYFHDVVINVIRCIDKVSVFDQYGCRIIAPL
jgi:hypothetical protein